MEAPPAPGSWVPPPEDGATLPAFLDPLVERLAERVHDRWARQRMAEGWTYGPVRDEDGKRTPNLVAYADLPESEKEVDRATALATLKALYAEGCHVAGPAIPAAEDPAAAAVAHVLAAADTLDFEAADRLRRAHDAGFWAAHPDLLLRLARRASDAGWPLMVFDMVSQALARREADPAFTPQPVDGRLLHLEVLSLMEIGALERAAAELRKLESRTDLGGELHGLQGRLAKTQGLGASSAEAARDHFARAGRIYFAAYSAARDRFRASGAAGDADEAYYLGINAATMDAWSGREPEGAVLAAEVLELCDHAERLHAADGVQPWLQATRGEAHLLRRDAEGAAAAYGAAAAVLRGRWRPLQSMRRQALETARRTGFPVATVEQWFALPGLHVAGLGGEPAPPAAGRPIVFHYVADPQGLEDAAALAGECTEFHVCFERPLDEFRSGLDPAGAAALERLLGGAARVIGQREMRAGGAETTPVFTRLLFRGLALLRARELDVVPSGLPALAACGVERGRELPFRAMLFADAKGYSRLDAGGLRTFVSEFLGEIGRAVAPFRDRTVTVKTAGDGLFIVFRDVPSAIGFSLELRDRTASIDWVARGFPGDLGLRISLDAGPVMEFRDPVSLQTDVAGQLVNRAARIEPVTPVNHIYASRTMAALALALDVRGVRFEYAGETPLPKKFGTLQLYHVAA